MLLKGSPTGKGRSLTRSAGRFLIAGGLTVLLDLSVYRLLVEAGWLTGPAKTLSFIAGTLFAYWINKNWTFEAKAHSHRALLPFMTVYCTTLCANVLVNEGVLKLIGVSEVALWVAFLVATGVSATLNFLGMQKMVFAH